MRTKGSISYKVLQNELKRLQKRRKEAILPQEQTSLDGSIMTIKKFIERVK